MKRILVVSDSHGDVESMITAVHDTEPDMIIHLGDCVRDAEELRDEFPEIPLENVPGNCDLSMEVPTRVLLIENKKIMICHGHTYNVKASYLSLELAGAEREADAVLFGHTHRLYYARHNGMLFLNPGSIGSPGYGTPPSYAILTVDGSSDTIEFETVYME